jgi:CBS domain-containing protein/anti-sigma regulatory factor (Ser/Thr protein kinase)
MRIVPINTEQSPLLLLELLFKLRIRDVMTRDLITVTRHDTLRRVQQLMKQNSITGIPVVENKRLFGLVSIDDIINALDTGYIDDMVEKHMTTNVVVVEDDMPLSIAISYFSKYPYGRFPVLNRENEAVGIITSRNINTSILLELFKELNKMESKALDVQSPDAMRLLKVYHIKQYDFENAGKASNEIKNELQKRNIDPKIIRRIAVACYELEMNQVVHSEGGTITCNMTPEEVQITAQDWGPGIENVDLAMQEGYTTANDWVKSLGFGAGMGLPNARRMSDEFYIHSSVGVGTTVKSVVQLKKSQEDAL